jgi:hypothetical protein
MGQQTTKAMYEYRQLCSVLPLMLGPLASLASAGAGILSSYHLSQTYVTQTAALERLCSWTASLEGLHGLSKLAKILAQPVIDALDHLLALDKVYAVEQGTHILRCAGRLERRLLNSRVLGATVS